MSTLTHRTVLTREKRNGSLAAYAGRTEALAQEGQAGGLVQRVRTFTQDMPGDLQRALSVLRTIRGLAIVVHGPAGCAASLNGGFNPLVPWIVTAIDERDSIMGSDRKLKAAILQLHAAHAPAAIAVVATPVVAINNDDIESVVTETREELGIPIIPVLTDGFRSKVSGTGYDAVIHALLREQLWHPPEARGQHVNLLSVAEQPADVDALLALLQELNLEAVVFPRHGQAEAFRKVSEARLSISIDPEESEYAGSLLQDKRGIPFLQQDVPVGAAATSRWLRGIGKALGLEARTEEVIARHEGGLADLGERLVRHRGARVFVNLPAAQAFAVIPFLEGLGLDLAGLAITALSQGQADQLLALVERHHDLQLLVGEGQVFEEVNLLGSLGPDLYLGAGSAAVHALRLGIPVLDLQHLPVLGYAGAGRLAEALDRSLSNPALARFLREPAERRYAKGWLAKSTHWFIKHEVK
jgi:nitrogenase molybdenum-iron protein alpha chain